MIKNCDNCGNSCYYTVHVGDCAYGNDIEDWDCKVMDQMTDKDVELANDNKCPYWVAIE